MFVFTHMLCISHFLYIYMSKYIKYKEDQRIHRKGKEEETGEGKNWGT